MHYLFVINPMSGGRVGKKILPIIEKEFKDSSFEIYSTKYAGDAKDYLSSLSFSEPTAVIACGGDGTANEVISALVGKEVPIGIIPIGSGNGLARNLGIPLDPKKALKKLKKATPHSIDCIRINEDYVCSNFGIGMDAQIIKQFDTFKTRGILGYIKAGIQSFFKLKHNTLSVYQGKEKKFEGKVLMFNVANANQIGYDFSFSPTAKLSDGLMDVLIIPTFKWYRWGSFFLAFLGKKLSDFGMGFTAKDIRIKIHNELDYFQIDGEGKPLKQKELQVDVIPSCVKILV